MTLLTPRFALCLLILVSNDFECQIANARLLSGAENIGEAISSNKRQGAEVENAAQEIARQDFETDSIADSNRARRGSFASSETTISENNLGGRNFFGDSTSSSTKRDDPPNVVSDGETSEGESLPYSSGQAGLLFPFLEHTTYEKQIEYLDSRKATPYQRMHWLSLYEPNIENRQFLKGELNKLQKMGEGFITGLLGEVKKYNWAKVSSPTSEEILTGRWLPEHHQYFLIGIAKSWCREWINVAEVVKVRTVLQCRSHAQKWLKAIKKYWHENNKSASATSTKKVTSTSSKARSSSPKSQRSASNCFWPAPTGWYYYGCPPSGYYIKYDGYGYYIKYDGYYPVHSGSYYYPASGSNEGDKGIDADEAEGVAQILANWMNASRKRKWEEEGK